jgi:hypothetical protein
MIQIHLVYYVASLAVACFGLISFIFIVISIRNQRNIVRNYYRNKDLKKVVAVNEIGEVLSKIYSKPSTSISTTTLPVQAIFWDEAPANNFFSSNRITEEYSVIPHVHSIAADIDLIGNSLRDLNNLYGEFSRYRNKSSDSYGAIQFSEPQKITLVQNREKLGSI